MSAVHVVIPAFNEVDNLVLLIPEVVQRLAEISDEDHVDRGRIWIVDDGSTDATNEAVAVLQRNFPVIEYVRLNNNQGKAAALQRGFTCALDQGASIVVMMDADGQDDPSELRRLIAELHAGQDLVTGARLTRQDRFIKRSTSKVYNRVTGVMSGAPGQDFNSGFKAMTAETASDITPMLYGELHRYITVMAHWLGYRVTEIAVDHHERMHGSTKYGINRFWRGFMDLLTVRFLMSYEYRPSHLFGGLGLLSFAIGSLMLALLLVERLTGQTVGDRPMLIAGVLLVVVGLQLFLFGLLAELIVYSRQQSIQQQSPAGRTID